MDGIRFDESCTIVHYNIRLKKMDYNPLCTRIRKKKKKQIGKDINYDEKSILNQ